MTTVQILAAQTALKDMFSKGHFSICVIDQILKMSRAVPKSEDYDALRLLHCINFRDMDDALRAELPGLIQRVLSAPAIMFTNTLPLSVARLEIVPSKAGRAS